MVFPKFIYSIFIFPHAITWTTLNQLVPRHFFTGMKRGRHRFFYFVDVLTQKRQLLILSDELLRRKLQCKVVPSHWLLR
ncbi:hypothetical protein [Salmonella phage vB_StyS-sam]|uniref:Uncharacterized protein n=1 Tax=Salmonella phage vB_StyS-sam TaxID=2664131 RepID=A0A5K7YA98_9CAUD|nr:hypothetical protein QA026_gp64 [Salmonella phage vB_StyS-sam]BBO66017.1 hypothetical protein [Salmonella phage vB_StyS-sam]